MSLRTKQIRPKFIWRLRTYFLRGHLSWFVIILNTLNFIVIQYTLLIETNDLGYLFGNSILVFAFVWAFIYIPASVLIGYWDYKKGSYKAESSIAYKSNPIASQMVKDLEELRKDSEEIKDALRQLTK